jgi:hypothetical protein
LQSSVQQPSGIRSSDGSGAAVDQMQLPQHTHVCLMVACGVPAGCRVGLLVWWCMHSVYLAWCCADMQVVPLLHGCCFVFGAVHSLAGDATAMLLCHRGLLLAVLNGCASGGCSTLLFEQAACFEGLRQGPIMVVRSQCKHPNGTQFA